MFYGDGSEMSLKLQEGMVCSGDLEVVVERKADLEMIDDGCANRRLTGFSLSS